MDSVEWRAVDSVANSGPSSRNYGADIQRMLAQADALRSEADSIDLEAEAAASLGRAALHGSEALECAGQNAARASEKVWAHERPHSSPPHQH